LKGHGDWLHPAVHIIYTHTTIDAQTYMLACCVFQIASRKKIVSDTQKFAEYISNSQN